MRPLVLVATLLVLAGCREELSVPSDCPEFCSGSGLVVRDTVVEALAGGDTTYYGYVSRNDALGTLVANGTSAGTAYTVITFEPRPDTIPVNAVSYAYTIDSVAVLLGIIARDTLQKGVRLGLYRLPAGTDSTATFQQIEAFLTPDRLVRSVAISDSLPRGYVRVLFAGDSLNQVVIPPGDSGRLSLAVRLEADAPTGMRLGGRLNAGAGPGLQTFVTTESPFPDEVKRTIETDPQYVSFVRDRPPVRDPDLLVIGGVPSGRTLLRFALPEGLTRGGALIRATLELTPAQPLVGLAHDPAVLEARAVVADLGYRSLPVLAGATAVTLPVSGADVVRLEVRDIVSFWRGGGAFPQGIYLSLAPEGYSYTEPVFHSTRSTTGRPRLRITYALPGRPEIP